MEGALTRFSVRGRACRARAAACALLEGETGPFHLQNTRLPSRRANRGRWVGACRQLPPPCPTVYTTPSLTISQRPESQPVTFHGDVDPERQRPGLVHPRAEQPVHCPIWRQEVIVVSLPWRDSPRHRSRLVLLCVSSFLHGGSRGRRVGP